MQALNIATEFRKVFPLDIMPTGRSLTAWADSQVKSGEWIEDDGDYYLPEVWATQYDEGDNYTGPTYPEYDD